MERITDSLLRQIFLLLLIGGIAAVLFWRLQWLTPAILWAYTLYVLLRPPLEALTRNSARWLKPTAVLLMSGSIVVLMVVVDILARSIGGKLAFLKDDPEKWIQTFSEPIHAIETRIGMRLLTPDNMESAASLGVDLAGRLFGATLDGIAVLAVGYFILFFMLTRVEDIEQGFNKWLPLKADNAVYLRKQLDTLVFANALGIPLMGVTQGLAGLPVYYFLNVPDIGLWFVLTCITGMLPFLGVALAYVPLSLLLFSQGQTWGAAILLAYGFIVMGSVDNLARMWALNKIGRVHPLVTLLGVVAGIPLFGFIGIIFGPILVSLLLILIQLYWKEFSKPNNNIMQ